MAKDSSFDIVSEVDLFEVDNAINMTMKEIQTRFDFKGSISKITRTENTIDILTDNDTRLNNIHDILEGKLVKREIQIGFLDYKEEEVALGGNIKQQIIIKQGIDKETSKEITKFIKTTKLKANAQIQDSKIRVTSAKKDVLQSLIHELKQHDFGIVLQFDNYR
ncbi:MAG: YajQ family cyclic di-GMP-binding protein [Candidatus Margulisbacteria bacterium GWF2_35_9]|nr:MAG: YajQ family cyclic di-GMP-binding protein [Candidatus Margulisbacteria bacterium GWF2_35_9]